MNGRNPKIMIGGDNKPPMTYESQTIAGSSGATSLAGLKKSTSLEQGVCVTTVFSLSHNISSDNNQMAWNSCLEVIMYSLKHYVDES